MVASFRFQANCKGNLDGLFEIQELLSRILFYLDFQIRSCEKILGENQFSGWIAFDNERRLRIDGYSFSQFYFENDLSLLPS